MPVLRTTQPRCDQFFGAAGNDQFLRCRTERREGEKSESMWHLWSIRRARPYRKSATSLSYRLQRSRKRPKSESLNLRTNGAAISASSDVLSTICGLITTAVRPFNHPCAIASAFRLLTRRVEPIDNGAMGC